MFTITLGNRTFTCTEQTSIIDACKLQFVKIPYGCCRGGCGMCKVKVVDGEYTLGTVSKDALSDDEREQGYVLACKTCPSSNLTIQVK
ncbi:2Fe-2S iron-sulfur cluster-binding protein [Microbacteriaceae bacterium 4G12]